MSETNTLPPPAPPAQRPMAKNPASSVPVAMEPKKYVMPRAAVNTPIVWYPYGETHRPGMPGVICEVGERTMSCSIFLPQKVSVMYKDGVRHLSDPDAKREEFIESGCWDYSEQTKLLMELRAKMERLES